MYDWNFVTDRGMSRFYGARSFTTGGTLSKKRKYKMRSRGDSHLECEKEAKQMTGELWWFTSFLASETWLRD